MCANNEFPDFFLLFCKRKTTTKFKNMFNFFCLPLVLTLKNKASILYEFCNFTCENHIEIAGAA